VPTATNGTNTTQAASTAFVINQIGAIAAGVSSFSAGTTGLTPTLATSGAITLAGTLAVANGGTGVTTSTGSGSTVLSTTPTLVTPILGTPTSGNLANCTFPTLNQNTTGTAAGLSATLAVASGGTGVTTSTGTGSVVLSTSPTLVTPILGTPQSGNFSTGTFTWPTFNQNTSGTAAGLSSILAVASGGTGTATPALVQGTGVTITGSWPNQTIAALGAAGQYQAVASGTLANGATVVVNSDGTVSAVNPITNGTTTTFTTDQIGLTMAATYDSSNQRVVVAYRDTDASNLGYAIVGTVSGTTISFGTPVQFVAQAVSSIALTFDSTNNKVVLVYNNTFQSKGYAAVGTVSGTSISFGTAVQVSSGTIGWSSAVFDAVNGKVVIAYQSLGSGNAVVATVSGTSISLGTEVTFDASNSWYISAVSVGTSKVVIAYSLVSTSQGKAIVGTVSGTSISFGTAVAFVASSNGRYISAAYDTTNTKVVIAYANVNTAPYYGAAIVGTVSGTSISFGTAVQFAASTIVSDVNAAYSPTAGRVLITYSNNSNSYYGTLIVGTVSGTSISFGPSSIFSSTFTSLPVSVYDSTSTKIVLSSVITGAGQSRVVTIGTSTNLTATNYIGISDAAYASGATATIQTVGSVDDAQTSLTPGLAYYVQTDGTLASTAGSPSVFAGTAVSATQILVKG